MSTSLSLMREKALPGIPVDIDDSETIVEHEERLPPSRIASTSKALPSINIENTLAEEEMSRLHELWNEAGLSARAHRRKQRSQNPTPHRIPAPIFIPEPEVTLPSVDPSIATTTGARKRWGFLSARPLSEKQEAEKKAPNALEMLRAMAQGRLKKKLRYTRSAPNLVAPSERGVTLQPAVPRPKDASASNPRILPPPGELATPEAVLQSEDMDKNAIYFTIDPTWRVSQGSMGFQFITPIPDSPTSLGRPDSPLQHRHHSLDQLSFAAQQPTAMESPVAYPGDQILHPIDELHTYLEL